MLERRPDNIDESGRPMYGRLQVINRIEIPQNEFTYDNAVRKIVELDKIYNPFAIYPDRGSGEYQIEILRKALGDKVKGIHLGSSYEVRDPHSREYSKKPIKPFIVNQTTMLLERGQLMIPHKDVDEVLQRQMTNYRVERIAPKTGEPTYTSEDEHALDGLMLGVFAFIEHHPELIQTVEQVQMANKIAFSKVRFVDPIGRIYEDKPENKELQSYIDKWDEPTAPPPRKVSGRRKTADFTWGSRGSSRQRGLPKRRRW